MKPILKYIDQMWIVGIGVRTTNYAESRTDTAKIPALWKRFFQEKIGDKIPNQIRDSQTYGVYSSYESDHNGKYTLMAGKCVSNADRLPREFTVVNIEAGDYLVFEGRGHIPNVVIDLWKEIWDYFSSEQTPKRKYTTNFELYRSDGAVAIHIAVA